MPISTSELVHDLEDRIRAFEAGDPSRVLEEQARINAEALWVADHNGESVSLEDPA